MRDVGVSPRGRVLGAIDPDRRLSAVVQRIHGSLLMGVSGGILVELAASWAMVLILTGLYLWWPRGRGLAGVYRKSVVWGQSVSVPVDIVGARIHKKKTNK